jgi:protein-tyrosine phosphatase
VQQADLVLTAALSHRDFCLQLNPAAMRKTFSLREFSRLGAGVQPATGPHDIVRAVRDVADRRGVVPVPVGEVDDVADPYGAPPSAAVRAAGVISEAVDRTLRVLGAVAVE